MNPLNSLRTLALTIAIVMLAGVAQVATPTRVAPLGYLQGEVSLLEAGGREWFQVPLNQPLTPGDLLWTDQNARAELQLEGAAIRMGEPSSISVLNLDERVALLQPSQDALRLCVREMGANCRPTRKYLEKFRAITYCYLHSRRCPTLWQSVKTEEQV